MPPARKKSRSRKKVSSRIGSKAEAQTKSRILDQIAAVLRTHPGMLSETGTYTKGTTGDSYSKPGRSLLARGPR